jgi:predicted metal-dependent peptidase
MFDQKLTSEDRIIRVKIQLQDEHPFWAYLIMKLKMQEDKGTLPEFAGMGVNAKGDLLWKKKFVDSLTDEQLKFVLAHEVGHLVFGHLFRLGSRVPVLFNIASDAVMNDILRSEGFMPPPDLVMPDYKHNITLFNKEIKNVDKKTAEMLYDELPKQSGKSGTTTKGFDEHGYGQQQLSPDECEKEEQKWQEGLVEAGVYAKQRGKLSNNMEKLIGHLMSPKFNWKQLLRRYLVNTLPYDFSFSRPNRKIPNIILPGTVKESVEIVAHIDTSGSIGQKEFAEFMSEVIGMVKSHNNVNMTVIECDAEIQQVIQVNTANLSKLYNMKIKGGGGTSHKPVWEYLNKKKRNCRLFISLTDLYSDVELGDKPRCQVLWVVPSHSADSAPFGKILKMN